MALPEIPDDWRAQPPRHGRSDEPSGWIQPVAQGQPGIPDRGVPAWPHLPSTPWLIDGLSGEPRHSGSNGHSTNGQGTNGTNRGPRHGGASAPPSGGGVNEGGSPVNGFGPAHGLSNGPAPNGHAPSGHVANGHVARGPRGPGEDGRPPTGPDRTLPNGSQHRGDDGRGPADAAGLGRGAPNGAPRHAAPDDTGASGWRPDGPPSGGPGLADGWPVPGGTPQVPAANQLPTGRPAGGAFTTGGLPVNGVSGPAGVEPLGVEPVRRHAPREVPGSGDTTGGGPAGHGLTGPSGPAPSGPAPEGSGPSQQRPVESPNGRQAPRRVHSDVPPPRRTGRPVGGPPMDGRPLDGRAVDGRPLDGRPVNDPARPPNPPQPVAPQTDGRQAAALRKAPPPPRPAQAGNGNDGASRIDSPTVAHWRQPVDSDPYDSYDESHDDAGDGFPGVPGRHRRRAGESLDGRPREQAAGREGRGGKRRRSAFWKELPILIVVALLLTFLIQTFIAKVYVIPSGSMETTLHGCTGCNNDRVLVDKVTYRFSDPQPGNVVVFRGPDGWTSEFTADAPSNIVVRALQGLGSLIGLAPPDEKDFIKRVIAVGGQTVQCCDSRNRVLVDGKPLNETYIYFLPDAGAARQDNFGPVTIPAGELWMMGDSRNNSADSRVPGHGPVPIANVIGQARMIVLPFSRFGSIPSPNPQANAAALGSGDTGAPVALGMLGLLPLVVLRRRERELGEFLPRRRT